MKKRILYDLSVFFNVDIEEYIIVLCNGLFWKYKYIKSKIIILLINRFWNVLFWDWMKYIWVR